MRPVHRGPTVNTIFPVTNVHYLILIDASSGYHNLRLKTKSYLTIFSCQFGRYRYTKLPFGTAPAGNMFQHKIDRIFKELPNVFNIANDISA